METNYLYWNRSYLFFDSSLTHWGRVMHLCISKLTIIGSDNGLSPGWYQAFIWTNTGILLIRTLGTKFNEILTHSRKCIWKWCLENGGHFVSASMCQSFAHTLQLCNIWTSKEKISKDKYISIFQGFSVYDSILVILRIGAKIFYNHSGGEIQCWEEM